MDLPHKPPHSKLATIFLEETVQATKREKQSIILSSYNTIKTQERPIWQALITGATVALVSWMKPATMRLDLRPS